MKTHEQSNQRQDRNEADLSAKPARDTAHELVEGIIRLVSHYASQERGRAVREGLARRRERVRQTVMTKEQSPTNKED